MKYSRPYYKFRFAKANVYKLAITFFLILFTSISSFGQTKEIRYYDGKYTQETALKKFYEFLKVYKDDKLQYNGKLEGNTIKANWKNTLLGSGYVVSNVQYTFYSDRIEIYLLLSTYYKDETNVIMLRPKSVDQQIVKLYKFEEDTHIHDVLAFMNIDKNITKETTSSPKTTTQTKSTTSEQTTETRYYNGRYDSTNGLSSKEVVLQKIKSYIDIKSKAGASFLKLEEKPDFLSGTWTVKSAQGNIVLGLDYVIGDKSLTIKLKYLTVGSQAISKNHPKEELRNLYNVAIENFVLELFKYLEIKDNTSPKQTTTKTAVSNPSGQTIETRTYNGKYTKETALKKINEYLKIVQSENLKFVGGESSPYQIDGIWEQKLGGKDKITVGIRYVIEDKSLSIMIISAVVAKGGDFIMLYPQSTDEANRNAYNNQVKLFVDVPFNFMTINQNIVNTQNNSAATNVNSINTKKTESNSIPVNSYSDMSTEAKSYLEEYRKNPNDLKNYLKNRQSNWEQKGNSPEAIVQICVNMFKEIYAKDKNASFELMMKLPRNIDVKKILPMLTEDERKFIREKSKERLQKYSGSYSTKTN
ncbi:hypothetical protein [Paenimyroides aestuarii]|uniref:DUF3887 domain-containing protein n=1 Tax=Paenimyroides aestuarii TaxID=2968490 RepID=A0ABY5NT50_9FLAO|nr:hypothetical protein [Paenimyroides aestuarii]UUV21766.1 hypothetical protein NPX36_01560 [Paenimyroides aestuarii]